MRALRDITDGAGMGVFSTILAKKIMALEVFTDRLETEIIRLRTGGAIQSDNYSPGTSGFIIKADGTAEFNDITLRNNLNAYGGSFDTIRILGDSFFEGDILSGPLELNSRNPSNITEIRIWGAGTTTRSLHEYILTNLKPTTPVNGLYGTIGFNYIWLGHYLSSNWVKCILYDKDRVEIVQFDITNEYGDYVPLQYTTQIGFYNPTGKTIKLNNLPLNEPTLSGAIWRDSQGYLRIKI
jgi:hypothetical protein